MQRIYIFFTLQVCFTPAMKMKKNRFKNPRFTKTCFTTYIFYNSNSLHCPVRSNRLLPVLLFSPSRPVNQPHDTPGKLLCVTTQKTTA